MTAEEIQDDVEGCLEMGRYFRWKALTQPWCDNIDLEKKYRRLADVWDNRALEANNQVPDE